MTARAASGHFDADLTRLLKQKRHTPLRENGPSSTASMSAWVALSSTSQIPTSMVSRSFQDSTGFM